MHVTLRIIVLFYVAYIVLIIFKYFKWRRFPHEHYGKLYGTGHFVGAIFGALQFSLYVLVHSKLQGNSFWVSKFHAWKM